MKNSSRKVEPPAYERCRVTGNGRRVPLGGETPQPGAKPPSGSCRNFPAPTLRSINANGNDAQNSKSKRSQRVIPFRPRRRATLWARMMPPVSLEMKLRITGNAQLAFIFFVASIGPIALAAAIALLLYRM